MAATVEMHVFTGTSAGTDGGSVTEISFLSIDSATSDQGTRTSNPITAGGSRSFEKWLKAKLTVIAANGVSNFRFWTDGAMAANTTLYCGTTAAGATPTASNSSVATNDASTYTTQAAGFQFHSASFNTLNAFTNYLVLQLAATASAAAGDWNGAGGETLNWGYDEV